MEGNIGLEFYLAPLEGVTGFVYRNVYERLFGGIDTYVTPFITPNQKKVLRTRERKDIAPENNMGMHTIPQLLLNDVDKFFEITEYLMNFGYTEFNINLGCPMSTVVTKKKGSGFLDDTYKLEKFFDGVYNGIAERNMNIQISVKTRVGIRDYDEWEDILRVYNQFPLQEVIIHPRLQKDFYNGTPNKESFLYAMEYSKNPVCYNGDIYTKEDYTNLTEMFPTLEKVMIGRGIIANPGLVSEINNEKKTTKEEIIKYHDALYEGYMEDLDCFKDTLFKFKELWTYLITNEVFEDCQREKALKAIRKAKSEVEYKNALRYLW